LMNYHFVSDVIAGSVLGAMIATYAAHLARLQTSSDHEIASATRHSDL